MLHSIALCCIVLYWVVLMLKLKLPFIFSAFFYPTLSYFDPLYTMPTLYLSVVQTNQRKARPDISVVPKETDRVGDILMIMIEGMRGNSKRYHW